jgi:predicted transcriptional regulator
MVHAIRDVNEIMRDEMIFKDKIVSVLRDGPKTIPEIAEALEQPSHEVVYWVMAMWRYSVVAETGKPNDEGYYQYQLTE